MGSRRCKSPSLLEEIDKLFEQPPVKRQRFKEVIEVESNSIVLEEQSSASSSDDSEPESSSTEFDEPPSPPYYHTEEEIVTVGDSSSDDDDVVVIIDPHPTLPRPSELLSDVSDDE